MKIRSIRSSAKEIDMINGPVLKPLIAYTIPVMLSGLLQLLFNAADVAVVGRFAGDNALAAVGSTGSLTSLITNLFIGLSVGTNVVAARARGAGDDRQLSRVVHTSMLVAFICGVALTIIGVIFAPQFLKWMGSPDGVIQLATVYLRIYFCGMIFSMLYNFGAAILRAIGDTRRPLIYLTTSGAINLVLNLIFVICFGMDVDGVALATVISQAVSAVLVVICLMRSHGAIHLDIHQLRIHKAEFKDIVRIGLPAGVQGMTFSISNVTIQSTINSFGATQVAGNAAGQNLDGFVHMVMNSFYQSCISFVGQNYGAQKYGRIKQILGRCMLCVLVLGLVCGVGVWYFGDKLLYIYTTSADVVTAGMVRLTWVGLPYVICGLNDCVVGALRGMGYSLSTMLGSIIGICGFRLLWVATVCQMPPYDAIVDTVYVSYPLSWLITLVFQTVFFIFAMRRLNRRVIGR